MVDMAFKRDGTEFYIMGDNFIYKYSISPPFAWPDKETWKYIGEIRIKETKTRKQ